MSHVLVTTAGEVLVLSVVNFQSFGIVNEIQKQNYAVENIRLEQLVIRHNTPFVNTFFIEMCHFFLMSVAQSLYEKVKSYWGLFTLRIGCLFSFIALFFNNKNIFFSFFFMSKDLFRNNKNVLSLFSFFPIQKQQDLPFTIFISQSKVLL